MEESKMTAEVIMYTTAVCPYCIRAERLLESKGVTALKKSASTSTRNSA
jgi:glutaredoxin